MGACFSIQNGVPVHFLHQSFGESIWPEPIYPMKVRLEMKRLRSAVGFSSLPLLVAMALYGAGESSAHGAVAATTATATVCPTPVATSTCSVPVGTPTISAINFSPANPTLNNPLTPETTSKPKRVTVKLFAYGTDGKRILPTHKRPLQILIFGAPTGVISPTSTTLTSGAKFQFEYGGAYLPNDLVLEAWMKNPEASQTMGVYSIGSTLILRANRQSPESCSYQTASFGLATDCPAGSTPGDCPNMTSPAGIQIQAAIGRLASGTQTGAFHSYTVDTGSLGTLVPQSQVPSVNLTPGETLVVGPGGPGLKYYDSNGGTCYQGQYWLAPVTFGLSSSGGTMTSTVTTHPVKVLVVPDSHPLDYMGVGFDRNSTASGDYFNSPADNAFLNLTDEANGSDISPGYSITPSQITLGVASAEGFESTPLQANQCVAGDYVTAPGCFRFPALPTSQGSFCGTLLMDTGIGDMYMNLGTDFFPKGYCESGLVPDGTVVQINSGTDVTSPTCYQYTVENSVPSPVPTPITPAPSITNCIGGDSSGGPLMFVNTGRHPLSWFTYLYDAACGQVGFLPNPDYQKTCP
jgi:hypothetical protein